MEVLLLSKTSLHYYLYYTEKQAVKTLNILFRDCWDS